MLAGSVAELTRVEVGGHDQAIMIRGASTENPMLLGLAGGPGGSEIGSMRNLGEALERDFVVATWDQRGTGKSATEPTSTSTRTVDQMVDDAIDATNSLRPLRRAEDLSRRQLLRTILGVLAAQRHPELYHAFVGSGQMVTPVDTDRMFFDDTLAWDQRTGTRRSSRHSARTAHRPRRPLEIRDGALHEHDWNPYPGKRIRC